jgi:hypothetical protein
LRRWPAEPKRARNRRVSESRRHRELGHNPDVEMLEGTMPVDFATWELASVKHAAE